MARIVIGTPFKDVATDNYIRSLVDMVLYTERQGHYVEYINEHGSLYDTRDRVFIKAMRDNFDFALQIDTDMVFPPDALCRLIERDKDIITGVYVGKEIEHRPVLFTELHKDDENAGPYAKKHGLRELMENDIFEVVGCGAGFLLVKEHVIRMMRIHKHEWFRPYAGLGEDVSFCQRAVELGFKIWADKTIPMGHTKYVEYTIDDWTGAEDEIQRNKEEWHG